MSGFSIDITGDIDKKLDEVTEKVKAIIQDELNAFGEETVTSAKLYAPVDIGFLRMHIGYNKFNLAVEIVVACDYAAFVEFGTGVFAAAHVSMLPPEIQAYAMTFFVNGKGRLPAHPYLFPAIEENLIKLKQNLSTI